MIAAPIGAWVAHRLPMRIMGVAVGGMIIFTNSLTLMRAFEVPGSVQVPVLVTLAAAWAGLVAYVTVAHVRTVRAARAVSAEVSPVAVG